MLGTRETRRLVVLESNPNSRLAQWPQQRSCSLVAPRLLTCATSKQLVWENLEVGRRRSGRVGGEHVRAGDEGGGRRVSLDGRIPYLLLRGCCSVVRDCLELPPVPAIFEGNTKACDGPDLLELPFFLCLSSFSALLRLPSSLFSTLSTSSSSYPLCPHRLSCNSLVISYISPS